MSQPSENWSPRNQAIMAQNKTSDARGFQQWKEVGRHVKKGARCFHITGPSKVKLADGTEEIRFIPIAVFRIEDTEAN